MNIRVSKRQRDLIDRAARILGTSRSDFMLEVACRKAEDVLLDRRFIHVEDEAFERFTALLDNPPALSNKLRRLLNRPAAWA